MSEEREILLQSIDQMLTGALTDARRAAAQEHSWCDQLWASYEELGLRTLLKGQADGGFGGDMEDGCAVARLVGRHAVPAPVMEDILVAGILPGDGFRGPNIPAEGRCMARSDGRVDAELRAVPWGRHARHVLVAAEDGRLFLLAAADARIEPGHNLAGEPRDDMNFGGVLPAAVIGNGDPGTMLVALRVGQIAGALEAALDLTIGYANQRMQFGRPIGRFQAVQQQLAVMAEEVAAAVAASKALAAAAACGPAGFEAAAAKLRVNRAIDAAVPIAHQTFGAIGFTQEHSLHRFTQRLLSWRSEQGGDRFWAERLGAAVIARGASALWSDLTARADALEMTR